MTKRSRIDEEDEASTSTASEKIDWIKKYFEKEKTIEQKEKIIEQLNAKLLEKTEKVANKIDDLNSKLLEKSEQLTAISVKAAKMEMKLKSVNNGLLSKLSLLSARGSLEYLEKHTFNLPANIRDNRSRKFRFSKLFEQEEEFKNNVYEFCGANLTGSHVGKLAEKVYANNSSEIHSFNKSKGVVIIRSDYSRDCRNFMRAVCATIPCDITVCEKEEEEF